MLGKKIKELRKNAGLGQVEFAKKLNIANGTVSLWENDLRIPDAKTIFILSKFFDVPIGYLFGETKNNNIHEEKHTLEGDLAEIFKKLNFANQNQLVGYAESLLQRQQQTTAETTTKNKFI